MIDLKEHDIVQLVTGGPAMAVETLTENGAMCIWFDGPKLKERRFHPGLLKKCDNGLSGPELARRIAFVLARAEHSEAAHT